ncbi:MAG TPA: acyl carrier protein [Methylocystis sp.]|nr:acyl carrier protein [Methylocystis sp.]
MQELMDLIALTMDVPSSRVNENSVAAEFVKWDSLRIVLLGSMLEQTYDVTLTTDETSSLKSVRAVIDVLQRHEVQLAA